MGRDWLADGTIITAETASPTPTPSFVVDTLTYETFDDHMRITGCDKNAETVSVLDEIDGKPATEIGNGTYMNCKNLLDVEIPGSITIIRNPKYSTSAGDETMDQFYTQFR